MEKLEKKVFLGGTCGKNRWRDDFKKELISRGIAEDKIFDPVVPDWNEEAQTIEDKARETYQFLFFFIGNPQEENSQISVYSLTEAIMSLYDKTDRTLVVFDTTGMGTHIVKAITKTAKDLRKRFPTAKLFDNLQQATDFLVANMS